VKISRKFTQTLDKGPQFKDIGPIVHRR